MKDSAEFSLKPNCSGIENVISKTDLFLKSYGIPKSTVYEQIYILNELVKFGSEFGNSGYFNNQIKVQINIDQKSIVIEVSKPIDGIELEHLDKLDKTIQFIKGFQDPFEAFMKIKSKPFFQTCKEDNGLRLAKIAYIGKAIVDFFIDEDNILILSAVRNLYKEKIIDRRLSQIENDQVLRQCS